jgi:Na+/H+ antiporter NhaC
MSTLFFGAIILAALMPWKRHAVDSHDTASWDKARRIEHGIQQAKENVFVWGVYSQ